MKRSIFTVVLALLASATFAQDKLITKTGQVSFYSHTSLEDITSHNYKVISTFTPSTGAFVFSIPMQSFELEPALRQKHFNSTDFLDTKNFPKAKFKGAVVDMSKVNLSADGVYAVTVSGNLEIHGVTKKVTEEGTITVKDGKISAVAKFPVTLKDYGIFFEKGKPSTNVSKTVEVTVDVKY